MPIVSVVACDTYQLDAVRQAVTAVLAPLGGMERFVRPGMRVLLKPNLLRASELEQAIITHPVVVEAVAELVREAGGTVIIGEGSASYEIIRPQTVGQRGTKLILGRHSGKHALLNRIKELKIRVPGEGREKKLDKIYELFKEVAATKKIVRDSDVVTIVKKITEGE